MDPRDEVSDLIGDFIVASDCAIENEENWAELVPALERAKSIADMIIKTIKESAPVSE